MVRMTERRGCLWAWCHGPFWSGVALGLVLATLYFELPLVNWLGVVPPIETQPLVVRQDAKGDGRFGAPRSGGRHHRGVDLTAPLGASVRAIRSGMVTETGSHRGFGNFVVLSHRARLCSLYAHLATMSVSAGQRVRQGQVIGTVGKTGNARGRWIEPHIHLEILRDGVPIDPATLGVQAIVRSPKESLTDGRGGE